MVALPQSAPLGVYISAPADVEPLRTAVFAAIDGCDRFHGVGLLSRREGRRQRGKSRKAVRRPLAPAGDEALTREEAAERLGETPKTLANWLNMPSKPQPFDKSGGRRWYLRSVIDRYLAERRGVTSSPDLDQPSTKPPLRRGPGRPKKKI
jgi:hypothetical protein